MKTINVEDRTHKKLWLFKIKCKAKNLDAVIQMLIKEIKK